MRPLFHKPHREWTGARRRAAGHAASAEGACGSTPRRSFCGTPGENCPCCRAWRPCPAPTTYKGLKEAEVRPGQWVVISGIGGLGHMAVQYAKAMGMHVAAVDVDEQKLALARSLGAEIALDARRDPAKELQRLIGGAHGVLVTAVSPEAFQQSIGMLRPHGTCALVGLPPGEFATPIFEVVLKRLTIRGSIVGTRMDLQESLDMAANGRVRATFERQPLTAINDVFDRMRRGAINSRVVLSIGD